MGFCQLSRTLLEQSKMSFCENLQSPLHFRFTAGCIKDVRPIFFTAVTKLAMNSMRPWELTSELFLSKSEKWLMTTLHLNWEVIYLILLSDCFTGYQNISLNSLHLSQFIGVVLNLSHLFRRPKPLKGYIFIVKCFYGPENVVVGWRDLKKLRRVV